MKHFEESSNKYLKTRNTYLQYSRLLYQYIYSEEDLEQFADNLNKKMKYFLFSVLYVDFLFKDKFRNFISISMDRGFNWQAEFEALVNFFYRLNFLFNKNLEDKDFMWQIQEINEGDLLRLDYYADSAKFIKELAILIVKKNKIKLENILEGIRHKSFDTSFKLQIKEFNSNALQFAGKDFIYNNDFLIYLENLLKKTN